MSETKYKYEAGYPLNLEAGSTETRLSAFQKVKSEFERIYRLLNSNLAEYEDTLNTIKADFDSIKGLLNDKIDKFSDSIDKKISAFESTLSNFRDSLKQEIAFGGYTPITLSGRMASGTATGDGFLIVDTNNSGHDIALEVYVDNTRIGYVSGDGSYGGSDSTTTIPVKKGSKWSINGAGVTNAWWFSVGNSTCGADAVPSIPSSSDSSSGSSGSNDGERGPGESGH